MKIMDDTQLVFLLANVIPPFVLSKLSGMTRTISKITVNVNKRGIPTFINTFLT